MLGMDFSGVVVAFCVCMGGWVGGYSRSPSAE